MTLIPFDTLACAKKLKQSGFAENHAEALTETMGQLFEAKNIATKQDVELQIEKIRADIKQLELSIKIELGEEIGGLSKEIGGLSKEIEESKTETAKWVTGILVAQAGLIIAAIKLL